jgi:hypothetical protein
MAHFLRPVLFASRKTLHHRYEHHLHADFAAQRRSAQAFRKLCPGFLAEMDRKDEYTRKVTEIPLARLDDENCRLTAWA